VASRLLDIGEVAQASGLAPSALRFYERKGLIRSVDRSGLRRRFEPDVLVQLAVIVAAQEVDFTLAEVRELLVADETGPELRNLLSAKADAVDAKIERLVAIQDRLRHAATCSSPRLLDCETFRGCLDAVLPRRHDPNPVS
jgi:DNA-binding transcriptional MerR regulator